MTRIFAQQALLPEGWRSDVRLAIREGRIASVETDASPQPDDERCAILLPGMSNLHSHAFQRGMAGLAEVRGPSPDSFWSWRETMYRFALSMTPDQVEAVAAQLYVEMLEAGFSRVGEFHYLHHNQGGKPYSNSAEMACRVAAAVEATGIGLTLLPVFYAHSGFGGAAPDQSQRRFVNDLDGFEALLESSRKAVEPLPDAVVGIAPHSLRAVMPDELSILAELAPDGPIHIHIAEQMREVEEFLAWTGARPVEWLLDHAKIDRGWCLIHATRMTEVETTALARSGAVAGLCPVTEANLGDGVFPAPLFMERGGSFVVGSDSNVLIGSSMNCANSNILKGFSITPATCSPPPGSRTAATCSMRRLPGGGAALGARPAAIIERASADLVSLNPTHATLAGKSGDSVLDAWIFANGAKIDCVWVHGKRLVEGGRHHARETVAPNSGP